MSKTRAMVGESYGDWLVESLSESAGKVMARCSCGDLHEVSAWNLRAGKSKRCRSCGTARTNAKHGMTGTRTHAAWCNMRNRSECVTAWSDFESFFYWLGECPEGHHLHRQDKSKPHGPGNSSWQPGDEARASCAALGQTGWVDGPSPGLGKVQRRALDVLKKARCPMRTPVLAGLAGASPGNMGKSMRGLEAKGLVRNTSEGWDTAHRRTAR